MKLVPLSVARVSGHPRRAMKQRRAARTLTYSRCTALVAIHTKTQMYVFSSTRARV